MQVLYIDLRIINLNNYFMARGRETVGKMTLETKNLYFFLIGLKIYVRGNIKNECKISYSF